MKVGDLVRHKQTGKISIIMWVSKVHGTHFMVAGFPRNQLFTAIAWERLSS